MRDLPCNSLEFAATFHRNLDDDVHETSFSAHDVDRHLDRLDDRHLDDPDHRHLGHLDHPDEHLHLDHPDDQRRHQKDAHLGHLGHLGHLDEHLHLDHLDEHRLAPMDALVRQFRQDPDRVQYPTIDLYVHQHRHLGDLLLDQLVESTEVDLHLCLQGDARHLVEAESDDCYLAEEELDDHLALCAQQARLVVAQQKALAH